MPFLSAFLWAPIAMFVYFPTKVIYEIEFSYQRWELGIGIVT